MATVTQPIVTVVARVLFVLLLSPPVLAADAAVSDAGKLLFAQTCQVCHQADAIGKPGFAPSLTNKEFLSISSDEFIEATIRDGRAGTGMPPFGFLGQPKVQAITAYLRSFAVLPDRSAETDGQPDAHGDPRLGKQWFDFICSTCHGVKGDGYAAGGTGTAIGKTGFLGKVSDGYIRTTIKEGRSNTRMLGFQGADGLANLTNEEIDDIIVYLRSLPGT
ncbi:MAG: c-type cytochrome [Proteobacteria bacterium]|nr:c-type cytochrome [Pseudomonadota bacterium]